MKTAISIPDSVFQRAEAFARRAKKSRSRLYVEAIKEYLDHHAPDAVTEAMNAVSDAVRETRDPFVTAAARRILKHVEW